MYKFVEIVPEIKEEKIDLKPLENLCPKCKNGLVVFRQIPCPDNIGGCLVLHRGYICMNCRTIFNKVEDEL